jgi:predicted unusual protein kinase regulating ubiquinone biosynthesis (AarF/ABC1/UbiB family)
MDYEREAEMLREIRESFSGDDTVVIPPVVEDRSGPRVLTMEYTPGTKINDLEALEARDIDRTQLAENLQRAYLQMIIEDGVFHADPHPGNLAVTDEGRIIFYDFGMSGRVDEFLQDKIVDFYVAVANQDTDAILDALVEMGTLSPEADRQVMGEVMELAIQDVRGEDIEQYRVQQIVGQIEDSIYEFPFRLPKNLALVLRVATVVEGVCVTLDPEFDFIAIATDYLTEQGYREEGVRQFFEDAGDQVQQSVQSAVRTPPKVERALDRVDRENFHVRAEIEDDNRVFDTLAKRLVYGLLLTAGVLSMSVLYSFATVRSTAIAGAFSAGVAFLLYRSFRSRKGLRTTPQFTRQNLKQRQRGSDGD